MPQLQEEFCFPCGSKVYHPFGRSGKEDMLVTTPTNSIDISGIRKRTLDEMIAPAWQIILYTALPTVRVRTEPAFRDIKLTVRWNFVRKGEVLLEDISTNR